jgi:hypothetical protein
MANAFQRFSGSLTAAASAGARGAVLPLNATGSYLFVRQANHDFLVTIGDRESVQVRKGTSLIISPDVAKRWDLQSLDTTEATTFELFISTAPIAFDDRQVQIATTKAVAPTFVGYPALAGGATETLIGIRNTGGISYRKSITVSAQSGGADSVRLRTTAGLLLCTIDEADPSFTLETSDDLQLFNPAGGSHNISVCEVFYLA